MKGNLEAFQGIGQFGKACRIMLENDSHAPGSVDRVLAGRMVRLCDETADDLYTRYTPALVGFRRGSRPKLEGIVARLGEGDPSAENVVARIARFCAKMGEGLSDDLDAMRVGGTEEEILSRGSDWCTDVARVACVLAQVAGLPARIVNLFDTAHAYSGHVIIEAFRGGTWGAADSSTGVVYRHSAGRPATTWELMRTPELIERHSGFYSTPDQFRAAAVVNYLVADRAAYDYTVAGVNAYCRSILENAARGWPGGLRWLHGEDKSPPE
jgi:transglutaminase-like putative cysteine protease